MAYALKPLVGGSVSRIYKERSRWVPAGLLLAITIGGGSACGGTGDAEPTRGADSGPSVTAGDVGDDDQEALAPIGGEQLE